jgi:hypothetical protein
VHSSQYTHFISKLLFYNMGVYGSRDDQIAAAQGQSRREDLSMGLTARTAAGRRTISRQARAAELRELREAIATARLNWEAESRPQQEEEDEKLLAAAREELRQILEATAEIRARRSGSGAIQPRRASEPIPATIRSFSPINGGRGEEGLNVRQAMDPGSGELLITRTNHVPASSPRRSPITTGHLLSIASNLAPNQLPITYQESSGQPTMHMVSLTSKDNPELKSLDRWSVDHFLSGRKHKTATTTARKINPGINTHVTRIFLKDKATGKIPTEYAAHDQLPDDLFHAMIYRNLPQTHGSLATFQQRLEQTSFATPVLQGSNQNFLVEMEKAFQVLAGAGFCDIDQATASLHVKVTLTEVDAMSLFKTLLDCVLQPVSSPGSDDKLRLRNIIYGKLRLAFETSDIKRDFQEFYERYGTLFLDELASAELTEAGRKLVEGSAKPSAATATGKAGGSSTSTEVLLAQEDSKAKKVKKKSGDKGEKMACFICGNFHPTVCFLSKHPDANHTGLPWAESPNGILYESLRKEFSGTDSSRPGLRDGA